MKRKTWDRYTRKGADNSHATVEVFTPDWLVERMCASAKNDIFSPKTRVLEPTSGDGAFTVYILKKRLQNGPKTAFFALSCLCTIYSIELNPINLEKQKNAILSVLMNFLGNKADDNFLNYANLIINKNFICGEFNLNITPLLTVILKVAGQYVEKFPVWHIEPNKPPEYTEEVVEL